MVNVYINIVVWILAMCFIWIRSHELSLLNIYVPSKGYSLIVYTSDNCGAKSTIDWVPTTWAANT